MGEKQASAGNAAGRSPLDGLAQRLGALEESLTVVASEMGVSNQPRFKHLDPDSVYREAVRRAQSATEPLATALKRNESRLDELAVALAQARRDIQAAREDRTVAEKLNALEAGLAAAQARLDAPAPQPGADDHALRTLDQRLEAMSVRLDTLWHRLDAQAREDEDRRGREPRPQALDRRLAGLEQRIEKLANSMAALPAARHAPTENDVAALRASIESRLDAVSAEFAERLERRLANFTPREAAAPPAIDRSLLEMEISRQLRAMVNEAAADRADVLPVRVERQTDRGGEISPLVMSAAERAIVRLTHRLEKLEEGRHAAKGENQTAAARSSRTLMGRLFES